MSNNDFDIKQEKLRQAKINLENAQAEYDKLLFVDLIEPLDPLYYKEPFQSELMQLKERNDQMLICELDKGGGKFEIELMQKLHDLILAIQWENENGETNPKRYFDITYRSCVFFLRNHHFSLFELINLIEIASKAHTSYMASLKAIKKLENDPKQKALDEIFDHYESRKSQFKRRGYTAEFVREMHAHYPVIIDIKTIQKLVASLNKDNEHLRVDCES